MFSLILMMLRSLFSLRTQAAMKAEIIALRHQVLVLQRTLKTKRLMLSPADRWLWVCLSRIWSGWRSALIIVKRETVVSWHRKAFRSYWTWKIRHDQPGRPRVPKETRDLIRTSTGTYQRDEPCDQHAVNRLEFSASRARRPVRPRALPGWAAT